MTEQRIHGINGTNNCQLSSSTTLPSFFHRYVLISPDSTFYRMAEMAPVLLSTQMEHVLPSTQMATVLLSTRMAHVLL